MPHSVWFRIRSACRDRRLGWLLIGALALVGSDAVAAPVRQQAGAAEIAGRKSALGNLRERIELLQKEVAAGESSRAEASDQLKESERAISEAQRELRELGEQRATLQATLRDLDAQTQSLAGELAAQQEHLGRLLRAQYMAGTPDRLRLLLSAEDPNQVARDLHYLNVIAESRRTLARQIESLLARKRALAERTSVGEAALARVEAGQRQRHERIAEQRAAHRQLLEKLTARLALQRKEIGGLKRDEQRLAKLVDRLTRLVAVQRPRSKGVGTPRAGRPPPPVAVRDKPVPAAADSAAGAFARLRGRLRLPVAGVLGGRFGMAREGGGSWKGIFIRAAAGSEARAVAPGRVVFADWMRGFGNLLIVDHGEGFLTIYGHNDGLLRQVGDTVESGDVVATVGSSGGQPESGLYFEIRHDGQPLNPLTWAKPR